MIIDVHAHIFPDGIAEKAASNIARFYNLSMGADGRLSTLLDMERHAGVDRVLLCSAATTPAQTAIINDFTSQTVAAHPGLLYGLGAMHQNFAGKGDEVRRIKALGLKGVKVHPDIQGVALNDARFDELYEALESTGMPLLAHTGDRRYRNSNPSEVLDVLRRFPRLTLIAAHLGCWSDWAEGARQLAGHERVYVDCSSSLYALEPNEARRIIRAFGAERVMFGSDYPMWTPAEELERLDRLQLTGREMDLILCRNAQALLGMT
ncbi:MAG: amidohydrolase family protein [Eubacteriales bacterium]|nr:amidohydrolase family protein [Christensenellaceae bacterium]MEA5067309.1 amidohydrolase family protein [Eubacteriales bacterium]